MRNGLFVWISVVTFFIGVMSVSAEPIIIAHRGASAVAPENTRSSIEAAIEMGAKVIEFDVRETSDGVLVLFHDEELDRLTGKTGEFASLSWNEVKAFDVGSWFKAGDFAGEKPMEFSEAVKLCLENEVTPLIEHKKGKPENYVAVLEQLSALDSVIVQSFDWQFLAEMKKLLPSLTIGALGSKKLDEKKMGHLSELKPDWVGWKYSDLSEGGFTGLKEQGYLVALWTVNESEEAQKWIDRGIDGVITDYPDRMMKLLD